MNLEKLKLEFKDVILIISMLFTLLVAYFTGFRDHESRIVRIETKQEETVNSIARIESGQKEQRDDLKDVQKDIKMIIQILGKK